MKKQVGAIVERKKKVMILFGSSSGYDDDVCISTSPIDYY